MWNIQIFDELPSTQAYAKGELQSASARHGDIIIALHQTEGKGRYSDRVWHDEPGMNLLMSAILTDIPETLHGKMQFVAGLSVLQTMRSLVPNEKVHLKWANDILVNRKKISGVLSEAIWSGNILKGIVLGIGINVNQDIFLDEVSDNAISLKQVTGKVNLVEDVRDLLLDKLQGTISRYSSEDIIQDLWKELEWMRIIDHFSITEPDGTNFSRLRYEGITDEGALRCLMPHGEVKIFQNATLHLS